MRTVCYFGALVVYFGLAMFFTYVHAILIVFPVCCFGCLRRDEFVEADVCCFLWGACGCFVLRADCVSILRVL